MQWKFVPVGWRKRDGRTLLYDIRQPADQRLLRLPSAGVARGALPWWRDRAADETTVSSSRQQRRPRRRRTTDTWSVRRRLCTNGRSSGQRSTSSRPLTDAFSRCRGRCT